MEKKALKKVRAFSQVSLFQVLIEARGGSERAGSTLLSRGVKSQTKGGDMLPATRWLTRRLFPNMAGIDELRVGVGDDGIKQWI